MSLDVLKHNEWVSEKVNQGWRYGLALDVKEKTDPRLRPYHDLTEKLKNL